MAGNLKEAMRQEALDRVLRRIRKSREFPVISKYLIEINQKLSDGSAYTTASELANIIIKDYALTSKLLKLVNSAFYGVVAGTVTTVSRAVIILGYKKVRLAAGTLILFEHFQNQSSGADMKEAVIHCFWCGLMAREIATFSKLAEPEEAFICAMLHDLGRLLVIYHMPMEFAAIKLKAMQDNLEEKKAAKAKLGISFSQVGKTIARTWGFPEKIQESMGQLSARVLKSASKPIDRLHAVAAFVNELGHGLLLDDSSRVDALFEDRCLLYKAQVGVDKEDLDAMVRASLDNMRKHAEALRLSIDNSLFLSRLEAYCAFLGQVDSDPCSPGQPEDTGPSPFHLSDIKVEKAAQLPGQCAADPIAMLFEGLQEVINAMAVDPDVNNVALMSLEVIYRALKFEHVILFINDTTKQEMEARFGYGCDLKNIASKVRFKIDAWERDIFCLAINSSQDLVVEDARDPRLEGAMPQWHHNYFKTPAFIFFPILYKQVCLGAIYADRRKKGSPISELEHRHVGMLRNQMILALKYCKSLPSEIVPSGPQ
ncbi:MAG: HDOD domain-containing protein [Desulfosarcinaceae bacterium]